MASPKTPDEGYIKFQASWTEAQPFSWPSLDELNHWRNACYEAGWIGAYSDGIGFGNISRRLGDTDAFYISGSATGNFARLGAEHYALVTEVDAPRNTLHCRGPVIASSESMSHAVIYRALPWVNGVIHIHHLALWEQLLHRVPTTDAAAPYGSPEMAASITHLIHTTDLPESRLFVMEGHREGIFAFGDTLEAAFRRIESEFSVRP
ncbi:MAG: class II aldolase/adducin family protein [Lewinella sp.]|nr:class II aldolase/adducin family protein [Lewinella sp.]